jgi:peptidoglycan/LPS O-acetylase OafA/YrhL
VSRVRSQFFPELESLRGIAALTVLLGHCYLFGGGTPFQVSDNITFVASRILQVLFDPQPAVMVFFTISGFVLSLQLKKQQASMPAVYGQFVIRRVFRIVPPMWMSVAFAHMTMAIVYPAATAEDRIVRSLFFIEPGINVVLWSLSVEFFCCLAFPLLYWCSQKTGLLGNLAIAAVLAPLMFLPMDPGPAVALQFVIFFQVGILVGITAERWPGLSRTRGAALLFAIAVIAYAAAPQIVGAQRMLGYNHWANWMWLEIPACFVVVWFVAYCSQGIIGSILRSRPARFFGRISFSLYLCHWPLLVVLLPARPFLPAGPISMILLMSAVLAISTVVAALSYKYIEVPSNRLGRRLSAGLDRKAIEPDIVTAMP